MKRVKGDTTMPWVRSTSVGRYGYTVLLVERTEGRLALRYGKPHNWTALGHGDWERGLREARELSALLFSGTGRPERGRATVRQLITRYFSEVSAHKNPPQPREEARRTALWLAFLEIDARAEDCTPELMRRFASQRRTGSIVLPSAKRPLKTHPSDTTIGHDIAFLQFVLNWSQRKGFIAHNPLAGYLRPKTAVPKRPVATYDRYLAVRAQADQVDLTGRFAVFLDLCEGLGWRRGALLQLRGSDIDRRVIKGDAPFGRIRKVGIIDKRHVEMWIPMSQAVRRAVDSLPVMGAAYLFPAPRRTGKPWRGEYARDLLEACERAAGLTPLEGGDFHPYRRAWATARKHLPTPDVMAAGGWRDRRTLETCYQQVDPKTLLAVMQDPTKLRDAK